MPKNSAVSKMSATAKFWATGLLLSFSIFLIINSSHNIVPTNATSEPITLDTIASISVDLKRLTAIVQNNTAQLEQLRKQVQSIATQLQGQSAANAVVPSAASMSSISSAVNSGQSGSNGSLPPLPECSNSSDTKVTSNSTFEEEAVTRRQFIVDMARSAWRAYKQHAWGNATLCPLSQSAPKRIRSGDLGAGSGETIIAGISTLLLMNLTEEAKEGLQWVVGNGANISALTTESWLFEKHIMEQWGGLLSARALISASTPTDAKLAAALLQIATKYAEKLKKAYVETLLPTDIFNMTREDYRHGTTTLSQSGGQYLEHAYFAALVGDESYRRPVDRIRDRLKVDGRLPEIGNLYKSHPDTRRQYVPTDREISLGKNSRDFYYNLLRSYLQSGGKLTEALQMYNEALSAILELTKMITTAGTGGAHVWVRDATLKKGETALMYGNEMSYSTCYLGAMLSLGATTFKDNRCHPLARRQRQLAKELTKTCRNAAAKSPTKLAPLSWSQAAEPSFDQGKTYMKYYLSPEMAESYFILWRTTKDLQYREAAWEMAKAISRYLRVNSGGFAGFEDVTSVDKLKDDQPAIFLSATLKYLYLTFTDDSVLPLDKWIFNSAGHPLPICGQHAHLPLDKCKYSIQI